MKNFSPAFAKAHAESKPEELLQHLSVMVATYTSIDIQIRRVPLGTLIRATARRTRSVYVFQTSSMRRALEADRCHQSAVVERRRTKRGAHRRRIGGQPTGKERVCWGAGRVECGVHGVCRPCCYGEGTSASDWIALVSALGGLSSFLGEQMEHLSKHLGAKVAAEGESAAGTSGFRARQALGEVSAEVAEREAMLKSSRLVASGAEWFGSVG